MLILASGSPRRQELLRNAGIAFRVEVANTDELERAGEAPEVMAQRLAREKAQAIAERLGTREPVLGADTVVVHKGECLAKPADVADAERMLRKLSGEVHEVITGVALLAAGGVVLAAERTKVFFRDLTDLEVEAYARSGEPMDKAGAYAIQGWASRWIWRIEGDYFNVVGLPVARVYQMLREHAPAVLPA